MSPLTVEVLHLSCVARRATRVSIYYAITTRETARGFERVSQGIKDGNCTMTVVYSMWLRTRLNRLLFLPTKALRMHSSPDECFSKP